jgi:hypothetical protein
MQYKDLNQVVEYTWRLLDVAGEGSGLGRYDWCKACEVEVPVAPCPDGTMVCQICAKLIPEHRNAGVQATANIALRLLSVFDDVAVVWAHDGTAVTATNSGEPMHYKDLGQVSAGYKWRFYSPDPDKVAGRYDSCKVCGVEVPVALAPGGTALCQICANLTPERWNVGIQATTNYMLRLLNVFAHVDVVESTAVGPKE